MIPPIGGVYPVQVVRAMYSPYSYMAGDTSKEAQEAQHAAYRRMRPTERVRVAVAMSEEARQVTKAGIRARYPSLSEPEIHKRLLRVVLGDALYQQCGINERR